MLPLAAADRVVRGANGEIHLARAGVEADRDAEGLADGVGLRDTSLEQLVVLPGNTSPPKRWSERQRPRP